MSDESQSDHGWNTRWKKALGSVQVNWSLHSLLYLRLPHSPGPLSRPPLLLRLFLPRPTRSLGPAASLLSGFWRMVQKDPSETPRFSSGFRILQHSLHLGVLHLSYQSRWAQLVNFINWTNSNDLGVLSKFEQLICVLCLLQLCHCSTTPFSAVRLSSSSLICTGCCFMVLFQAPLCVCAVQNHLNLTEYLHQCQCNTLHF